MSILFSAPEVVKMALEIERNGIVFYNAMANKTDDENVRELCVFLAGEEVRHKITFQKVLDGLVKVELKASEEEEYNNYLRALTSSRIFKTDVNIEELMEGLKNDVEAIDLAIETEKDSILFYYELMDQSIDEDRSDIEGVIKEEKAHYAKLMGMRGQLVG